MRILWSTLNSASKSQIRICDILSKPKGQKILLKTNRPNQITWYACGPTVYDSAHIGHASSYIRLDVIRRILERHNFSVLQVMGITDIDDKIINRANKHGVRWDALARKYELEFTQELRDLNVEPPFTFARVTKFIPHIITFVENLISNGYAYATPDGSVYFKTDKYKQYGIFSSTEHSESQENSTSGYKENKRDFALWKASKPLEPFWVSPWGQGRPGWHIECSVIASHYFGKCLDIHSGGNDLIFPHHENEEAQCCARFELKKWVTHWIHTGHLIMSEGVKMSKSLGNTLTISEFLKTNSADSLRMLCLMHNYRTHLFFTNQSLQSSKNVLKKIQNFLQDCSHIVEGSKRVTSEPASVQNLWHKLTLCKTQIEGALLDDFDTPTAVNSILDVISYFHKTFSLVSTDSHVVCDSVDYEIILACQSFVGEFLKSLGFLIEDYAQGQVPNRSLLQPVLQEFVDFRQSVRSFALVSDESDKMKRKELIKERKQLIEACDQVRDNLLNCGVEIKDHGRNSSWSIIETKSQEAQSTRAKSES